MRTSGPITALGPITAPAPISARGPITAPGSTVTSGSSRAVGMDIGAGRHAVRAEQRPGPCRIGIDPRRDDGAGAVGFARHQRGDALRNARGVTLADQAGGGPGLGQLIEIFGIVEKDQIAGPRPIERRHIDDLLRQIDVARRLGPGPVDDFRQGRRDRAVKEFQLIHVVAPNAGAPKSPLAFSLPTGLPLRCSQTTDAKTVRI